MDAAAAARARRGINRRGHMVRFKRAKGGATAQVKAVIEGYSPDEYVNGITAGTRHLIVSVLDLQAQGFPVPVAKGDNIYLGPNLDWPTTVQTVDTDHREYQGCYEIVTSGQ
ncbi:MULTISPECIES: hypothetical protein [unclassified Bradyrhizobium]|uniref:hypothetical protein n=1 Tax=Bradyrhizobium sp. USDA 4541 TaxID=2817704 RepID=UPI0020A4DECC|nr:hypothetical protein [Bradyrhizobium sp. USDA 4541]MCP1852799.1 hypothetical protein [Bradyrhizobium sp. USDA 4541]